MRIPVADRLLAVLGYVPFLFWVPVVLKRDSMFCQFHGRQAGVLWGLWFVPVFLMLLVSVFVPDLTVGAVGPYYFGTMMVWTFLYLLFVVVGIFKALVRERYRMPIVADLALKMGL